MKNKIILLVLLLLAGSLNAAVKIAPNARLQYLDGNGDPCSGCKLHTYVAGTTTNQATYTDSTGVTANSNPIVLNSTGYTPNGVWLSEGDDYKFILRTAADVDVWSEDNVNGVNDSTVTVLEWTTYGTAPIFISTTSFTLAGDQTDIFEVGRRIRTIDSSGTDYGTIVTSAFTSLTTVTVAMDNSQVLDSGLSQVSYGLISVLNTSLPQIYQQAVSVTSSGTDTIVLAPTRKFASYDQGLVVGFVAGGTNTGATTLNISGLGAQSVVLPDGSALGSGQIVSGRSYIVMYDGTNFVLMSPSDSVPIGTVSAYAGETAPTGWFICKGQVISRTTYSALFAITSDSYGDGDGSTTFSIPDLRGEFIRGWMGYTALTFTADAATDEITTGASHELFRDGTPVQVSTSTTLPAGLSTSTTYYTIYVDEDEVQLATSYTNAIGGTQIDITDAGSGSHTIQLYVDPDYASRLNRGDGVTGDQIGTRQLGQNEAHTHSDNASLASRVIDTTGGSIPNVGHSVSTTGSSGGNEARPRNISLNYIIKY